MVSFWCHSSTCAGSTPSTRASNCALSVHRRSAPSPSEQINHRLESPSRANSQSGVGYGAFARQNDAGLVVRLVNDGRQRLPNLDYLTGHGKRDEEAARLRLYIRDGLGGLDDANDLSAPHRLSRGYRPIHHGH